MTDRAFPSPESCALAGYPDAACARAVASAEDGDVAVVLVVTPESGGYEYLVSCVRDDVGWHAGGGGNGSLQWHLTEEDRELGWLAGWGRAARGARAVRVEYAGNVTERPIGSEGYFLWLLTEVPCPEGPVAEYVS